MAAFSGSTDHSMPRPPPWPKPTSSNPTLATSDTPNHIEALPIKQSIINPSSTTMTPNTEPSRPENLHPQPMPPFLTLPTEIHLLIFEHLDSIHTLCLLIQTCKQLHAFWHHNALSICANRAAAKSHTARGCELALSQQQSADARVPNLEQTPRDSDEEEQRKQANKEIAERIIHNNALVYQAGVRLISQLREEAADGNTWAGMLRREGRSEGAQHPVGKGFRAEMARMTLSVGERRRFEDAYYGFWIGVGVEGVKGGGGKLMRHGELELRSLFLGKVMLRGRGG